MQHIFSKFILLIIALCLFCILHAHVKKNDVYIYSVNNGLQCKKGHGIFGNRCLLTENFMFETKFRVTKQGEFFY